MAGGKLCCPQPAGARGPALLLPPCAHRGDRERRPAPGSDPVPGAQVGGVQRKGTELKRSSSGWEERSPPKPCTTPDTISAVGWAPTRARECRPPRANHCVQRRGSQPWARLTLRGLCPTGERRGPGRGGGPGNPELLPPFLRPAARAASTRRQCCLAVGRGRAGLAGAAENGNWGWGTGWGATLGKGSPDKIQDTW